MLNKKGLSEDLFQLAIYIILMGIFMFILRGIITQSIEGSVDTSYLEHQILYNRIILSKDSIFYHDKSIGRVYPGIVDIKRLYEDTLQDLYGEQNNFGVKVSLGNPAKQDIFYNKELYERGEPIFQSRNPYYQGIRHSFPVVVEDNEVLLIGLMYQKW